VRPSVNDFVADGSYFASSGARGSRGNKEALVGLDGRLGRVCVVMSLLASQQDWLAGLDDDEREVDEEQGSFEFEIEPACTFIPLYRHFGLNFMPSKARSFRLILKLQLNVPNW
jgi:hypothetical protein